MRILVAHPRSDPSASWDVRTYPVGSCRSAAVMRSSRISTAGVPVPMPNAVLWEIIEAGSFGRIRQYGVGLERADVEAATEVGVWVARRLARFHRKPTVSPNWRSPRF